MANPFPELPPMLRNILPDDPKTKTWWMRWIDPFYKWWQAFKYYLLSGFFTQGDVTLLTAGKGVVFTTPDGTKQYRIAVSNSGTITVTLIT